LRTALISAISACAGPRFRKKARRFLQGLSRDELQYIAEFLGACVLESSGRRAGRRRQLAEGVAHFAQLRRAPLGCDEDQAHKMILLLEYLCRCRLTCGTLPARDERTNPDLLSRL